MKRRMIGRIGLCAALLLAGGWTALAAGIADFKLTRAIPADAMLVMHSRDHAGQEFLRTQYERVWEEVHKQNFDKDIKRMLRSSLEREGGDVEAFDAQWQMIADAAATVEWGRLAEREFALAARLTPPTGVEFAMLLMPPAADVEESFQALAAILERIAKLDEQGVLALAKEGEGASVLYSLSVANAPIPIGLKLAREGEVIILGVGVSATLPDQMIALLQGQTKGEAATLAGSERFKAAFQRLPAPQDGFFYVDLARVMSASREFARMFNARSADEPNTPSTAPAATQPLAFLPPLVDALDLWEYIAAVTTTDGMKTTGESVVVWREGATRKPFGQALFGNRPLKDPLKYIPADATSVNVTAGLNFRALYDALLDFVEKEVPNGDDFVAQWNAAKARMPFDVEQDLLDWLGGGFATFSAPGPTQFQPSWMFMIEVRDGEKAAAALEKIETAVNEAWAQQNAGIEDAKLEGAAGFKRIVLPGFFAMLPGLGRPMYGVKDGWLFVANGPDVLESALEVGAGEAENFSKNRRYQSEGLPISGPVTSFAFEDLTKWAESTSQALMMVGGMARMVSADIAKDPVANGMLNGLVKLGNVVRKMDFYKSSCSVTATEGNIAHSKFIVNYQEPPRPATSPATTQPAEPNAQPG